MMGTANPFYSNASPGEIWSHHPWIRRTYQRESPRGLRKSRAMHSGSAIVSQRDTVIVVQRCGVIRNPPNLIVSYSTHDYSLQTLAEDHGQAFERLERVVKVSQQPGTVTRTAVLDEVKEYFRSLRSYAAALFGQRKMR